MMTDKITQPAPEEERPSIGAELRAVTQGPHQALERGMFLLDPNLSLDRYRGYLERFYGFYRPLEERLAQLPFSEAGLALAPRLKVPKLEADLRFCGADVSSLPLATGLPSIGTLAEGMGVLYVLEGATLGGQVIGRHLARSLGIGLQGGATFFLSYGAEVGEMWKGFQRALSRFVEAHPGARGAILATALDTFEAAQAWLPERQIEG